jgi:CheY-like chemotaxis protein
VTPQLEVFFVEDSAGDALLTGQVLADYVLPVKLTIARDGSQALIMLANPAFNPVLIILDLNLPLVSGFDVLERNPRKEIPLVIFSVSSNPADEARALAQGAREYVQKPTDLQAYKDAVVEMIDKWALPETNSDGAANK